MSATNPNSLSTEGHYTPPRDGCRDLWAEVIAQAVRDARSEEVDLTGKAGHRPSPDERANAIRFLSARTGDWAEARTEIAEIIGLDPDALRERVCATAFPAIQIPAKPAIVKADPKPPVKPKGKWHGLTAEEIREARRQAGIKGGHASAKLASRKKADEASSPVLQEMRRLWVESEKTARAIGEVFGLTHGAVIGHANRRGWGPRPAGVRKAGA